VTINWRDYCKGKGIALRDGGVEVQFESGRRQQVTIEDGEDAIIMRSVAARAAIVRDIPDAPLTAWLRNRSSTLVGFRVDNRGRMVGEVAVPKVGLTVSEFQLVLRHLAAEVDRFEFQLSGLDQE